MRGWEGGGKGEGWPPFAVPSGSVRKWNKSQWRGGGSDGGWLSRLPLYYGDDDSAPPVSRPNEGPKRERGKKAFRTSLFSGREEGAAEMGGGPGPAPMRCSVLKGRF